MYIRFVVGTEKERIDTLHGPFTEAKILRDSQLLHGFEVDRINEIFLWFNEQLPCPPFEQSSWPKNAVTWFKTSAQKFISRMYDIQAILNEHGIQVRTVKTGSPGKILYEDEYQIVAVSAKY